MRYISTRGEAPELGFEDALLAGLARDGGLYVPKAWPRLAPRDHRRLCRQALRRRRGDRSWSLFAGGAIPRGELLAITREAYARFGHPAVTPLVQIGPNSWILELFHGPTLAFKDVAMQVLARLMDRVLGRAQARVTVVGATSGDTGGAAIEAFRGSKRVDAIILFPHGRVSDVQRRMMTTATEPNVHAVAIDGTFDDCQALLKAMFNDLAFRDRVQAGRRQFHQLGARGGADHLLLRRRDGARRPAPRRLLLGADRQLRRHLRRLRAPSAWACRSSGW